MKEFENAKAGNVKLALCVGVINWNKYFLHLFAIFDDFSKLLHSTSNVLHFEKFAKK